MTANETAEMMTLGKGFASRVAGLARTGAPASAVGAVAPLANGSLPGASLLPAPAWFSLDAGLMPADAVGPEYASPRQRASSAQAVRPVTPTGVGRAPGRRILRPATEMVNQ
jgi:hypothetical protein